MDAGTFRLGVIGHRYLGGEATRGFVQHCCTRVLAIAKQRRSPVVAISALADGADSVFAQAALSLGIRLELVSPFPGRHADAQLGVAAERYRILRARAASESVAHFDGESPHAYRRSMQWVTFQSHALVVVWDGVERGLAGGTWETVTLARQLGKPTIHIDNVRRCVHVADRPVSIERAAESIT